MGLKNGTGAYNMVYGNNPLFVNIIDEKEKVSNSAVEIVDLPTISMTALMSFANNCMFSNRFIGQLVVFRDRISGTVIATLRDSNCVISEDSYPLDNTDECIIPRRTLNCEDEIFYRDSYFRLASKIQKANRESFITIVPIRSPSEEEMKSYINSRSFDDDEQDDADDDDDDDVEKEEKETCRKVCNEIFPRDDENNVNIKHDSNNFIITNRRRRRRRQERIGMLINEPHFVTFDEIASFGYNREWVLKCHGLLKRFEGIVLFVAQDIIRRLLEILPQREVGSARHVLLLNDGECHPIKQKERNTRKAVRDNGTMYASRHTATVTTTTNLETIEKRCRLGVLRKFLLRIPACILNHYLLSVLRIPLVCRLGAKTVFYNKTDRSEAETIMVHVAGYLCDLSIPHKRHLSERKLTHLDASTLLSSVNEREAADGRRRNWHYTWNDFREKIKCDGPLVINLYSSDNDVLHKWNMCASHSVALSGNIKLPRYVTGVRFYRTMMRNFSKTWMPPFPSPVLHGPQQYQARYELTVTHVPHDMDAGMLLMILCGSDYNDAGITFNESLEIVYREMLNFKRLACTCHRGWKDFAALVAVNDNPLYLIGEENTTVCRYCHKIIIRQFWETKSFFASIACLLMKELDPHLLFNDDYKGKIDNVENAAVATTAAAAAAVAATTDDEEDILRHRKVAINCICNICAILLLGKFNKLIYGRIYNNESLLELLEYENARNKRDLTDGTIPVTVDSMTIASYIIKFDRANVATYTAGGIRHWRDDENEDNSINPTNNKSNDIGGDRCFKKAKAYNDSKANILDVTWCNKNYKVLSSGEIKNEDFWKCMFDTSLMLSSNASLPLEKHAQIDDDTLFRKINIRQCLAKKSFSVNNNNVIKTITNSLLKNKNKTDSISSISGITAVNRFIDLILTIYLYIIGEDSLSVGQRVPIEHNINSRTNITIKDMIRECLTMLYSNKLMNELGMSDVQKSSSSDIYKSPPPSFVKDFMNKNSEMYHKFSITQDKFRSLLIRYGSSVQDSRSSSSSSSSSNHSSSDSSTFPFIPLLGEARLFTPLTLWTVYLSIKNRILAL